MLIKNLKFWESQNQNKFLNQYPWDNVVTFVNHYKKTFINKKIKLLELGCGSGGNLIFSAEQKIETYGLDISKNAIKKSQLLAKKKNMKINLFNTSFENIPLSDGFIDLVIDRASLTCVSFDLIVRTSKEINRVLCKGGLFFFNIYSKKHSSYIFSNKNYNNNKYQYSNSIKKGTLKGINQICFFDKIMINKIAKLNNWKIISIQLIKKNNYNNKLIHVEWEIIFKK